MVPGLIVTSFWTPNWEYEQHAQRMREECRRLGVPIDIRKRPNTGTYLGNCRQKPEHIREVMEELDRPLLWIDVDGSLLAQPTDLRTDVDFMACRMSPENRRTWQVGVLFFNATPAGKHLLDLWAFETRSRPGTDEASFDRLWKSGSWNGFWAELPRERYYDILRGSHRTPRSDAVVAHRLSKSEQKRKSKGQR